MKLERTSNGVRFRSNVVSRMGSEFILFADAVHSPEDIKRAKSELRKTHNVLRISMATEEDWDDLFLDDIFKHPEVKALKWFEVNHPHKLIRAERQKGTSPEDFVKKFILPHVETVRAAKLRRWPWLANG